MVDQSELFERLNKLHKSHFGWIVENLDPAIKPFLISEERSISDRSIDLIDIQRNHAGGLERLQSLLDAKFPVSDDLTAIPACPYRGLFAFQEDDARFFFGREAFIPGLVREVESKPLVAVVGASGSGKSSLVFAGLLPRLRQTNRWLIGSLRPEKQPFFTLADALIDQLAPNLNEADRIDKDHNLANAIQKHGIAGVVSKILQKHPGKRLLLVVDQFEELYTQCSTEERNRFIDVLLEGINKSVGLKVVLTLRADFCGRAYEYRPLVDALQNDLKLGPMNPEELRRAIERPAELMKVNFEQGLIERLLDDVGEEAGNLPLLEFVLTGLWQKQHNKTLLYREYDRLGGVAEALANHADTVYASLDPESQKRTQSIFIQLVRPGEGTEATRRVASRVEVGENNWNLVSYLADARLVVTGRDEETVEVIHETLLRKWEQLRKWMKQNRDFRIWQEELRFARRQWQQSKQEESALLDGFLLSQAEEWQSKRREDLSLEDQEFIQQSLEARERRIQQRLNELQEMVEQKDKALQAEAAATEQARKATRAERMRARLATATAGLAVMAAVVTGFVWQQRSELRTQQALLDVGLDRVNPATARYMRDNLPNLLAKAKSAEQKGDIDQALIYYHQLRVRTVKLLRKVEEHPQEYENLGKDQPAIQEFAKKAEDSLANIIKQNRLDKLRIDLQNKNFGARDFDKDFRDYEEPFTAGALQTTYEILMRSFGVEADINNNGRIDDLDEARQIPCDTFRQIEELWRKATSNRCGWYGFNPELLPRERYIDSNTECHELENLTLTSQIFNIPFDIPVIDRLEECKIAKMKR